MNKSFDAIVVGSGPNGLAAAITLQMAGVEVLLIEGQHEVGGGLRTKELTLPGFLHDVCSAVHPMAIHSPFFAALPLEQFGLRYLHSPVTLAHPFSATEAAGIVASLEDTAASFGADKQAYLDLIGSVVERWPRIINDLLRPLRFPKDPFALAGFGLKALQPASQIVKRFATREARGVWAGMAGHSIRSLDGWATASIGLVLNAAAHIKGWPVPAGGSQSIAKALSDYFVSLGGVIETGTMVERIEELPPAKAFVFDVTPRQLLRIAGHRFSSFYRWQLERFRYGMGVFKIDWALRTPIPFGATLCRQAATLHLGGTFEEISFSEKQNEMGHAVSKPFVLLAQQSIVDPQRAPDGLHTAWAYCHVPHGSNQDMTAAIENQVERFAPGFKELILARHTMNARQMESYNPNYVGGDIGGGIINLSQLYTRPSFRLTPYRTSDKQIFISSSSTPPGGGVHGMCGYHAARTVLKDIFHKKDNLDL